jgi:iron complex outermembrane receptor protein
MKNIHLIGASSLAIFAAMPLAAQTADRSGVGDIVVTATKRAQSLQDVPISVSVTSSETIKQAQIVDLIDLQSVVPSLKVYQLQNTGQTGFSIRGFGNGTGNPGIEASVGVFVDGVYRSRSSSSLADLPDLERVEVLRGPQSTLFGKNVSVGAVSIVTKAPNFKWGGYGEATIGNYGEIIAKGAINAPLSDTVAVRLYGSVNQRNGYSTNITPGVPASVNDRNRYTLRGDILWKPTSNFQIRVIGDYNHINEVCCSVTSIHSGPATALVIAGLLSKPITNDQNPFSYQTTFNQAPSNLLEGGGISGQADLQLSFAKLTSITAYRDQKYTVAQDIDFTGADLANQNSSDRYKTFSQEFRLTSTGKGPFSWLIGAFYSHEDIATDNKITYGSDAYNYFNAATSGAIGQLETLQYAAQGALFGAGAGGPPTIFPGKYYFQKGQGIDDNWDMIDQSFSIFGQADYKILPKLTLTGGIAYLYDKKQVTSAVILNDTVSGSNFSNVPLLGVLPLNILPGYGAYPSSITIPTNLFAGLNAVQFFYGDTANHGPVNCTNTSTDCSRSDDKVNYTARLAYEVNKHVNLYASYSTGWKGAAANLSNASRPVNAQGYGRFANPESTSVYEVGIKTRFRQGYANLTGFYEKITNLQSNAFVGTAFQLANAGAESVKGFEFDSSFSPIRALMLGLNATYIKPKYDSFTGAPCATLPTTNPCAAGQSAHDVSGSSPSDSPPWTVTGSATYTADFHNGYSAYIRGEYDYASSFLASNTVPSQYSTTSVDSINASLGIQTPYKLDITAWVRNLTNDRSYLAAFQTTIQTGSYSAYPNEPRTYGVTIRKTF